MWAFEGRVMMTERRCENCRWWDRYPMASYGMCRRNPPMDTDGTIPQSAAIDRCGEWSDASITSEQEEMRELTRRFAVALINSGYDARQTWQVAAEFAAAESQIQREGQQ